jgi:glutathione S-transferase
MRLILETAPPAFGIDSPSPFCLKAELLLEMSGLPHERRPSDPRKGPRGKIPFLHDGDRVIPDSRLIQRHLEEAHGVDFDGALTRAERARATAIRRLVEEHLYWAQVYFRWERHPDAVRRAFFGSLPGPLSHLVFAGVRRSVRGALRGHGLGRMTEAEVVLLATEDLTALATLVEGPFVFGDRLTSIDATVAGLVVNLLAPELPGPLDGPSEPLRGYAEGVRAAAKERAHPGAQAAPSLRSAETTSGST